MTVIPLLSFGSGAPKKVALPLMKAHIGFDDQVKDDDLPM